MRHTDTHPSETAIGLRDRVQLRIARHTERLAELTALYPVSLLVLYLGDVAAVRTVAARLAVANPYWSEHGSTFEDPDGFRVVHVPAPWPS